MKSFLFSLVLILTLGNLFGGHSQIILINSEAHLVELDENYDVLVIHERIPEYFQDNSSHETILASYTSTINNDIGEVDTEVNEGDEYSVVFNLDESSSCSWSNEIDNNINITEKMQLVDYQRITCNMLGEIDMCYGRSSINSTFSGPSYTMFWLKNDDYYFRPSSTSLG